MSSSPFSNKAFDALLAESAASIGSDGDSKPITVASKFENTFVKFDDVVVKSVDVAAPPGGVESILQSLDEVKTDSSVISDDWCQKGVLTAPHLILVGSMGVDLCQAKPTSNVAAAKWCYDTKPCAIKAHVKADNVTIEPGLYVKATGKGKLAFVLPHVPLEFVEGKGYARELLKLPMNRSMHDWNLLFQILNLHSGEFELVADLERELSDLKIDAAAFKTPKKAKTTVKSFSLEEDSSTEEVSVQKEEEALLKNPFVLLKDKIKIELNQENSSHEELLTAFGDYIKGDPEVLGQIVAVMFTYVADTGSLEKLSKALKEVELDTKQVSAKLVELLSKLGDSPNDNPPRLPISVELDHLSTAFNGFKENLESMKKDQITLREQVEEDEMAAKDGQEKSIKLFRFFMNRQGQFNDQLQKITESINASFTRLQNRKFSSKNELDKLLHGLDDNPSLAHNQTSSGNIPSVSSSSHQVPNCWR